VDRRGHGRHADLSGFVGKAVGKTPHLAGNADDLPLSAASGSLDRLLSIRQDNRINRRKSGTRAPLILSIR
jgi:hypothetical protein